MPKPTVTLAHEISDLKRELGLRKSVYARQLAAITSPRERDELATKHAHQLACSEATLARLEALLPTQTSLF